MNEYLPHNVTELVEQLQLIPHPEGGFFRETYRSGSVPMTSRGLTDQTTASLTSRSLVQVAAATHKEIITKATTCNGIQTSIDNDGTTTGASTSTSITDERFVLRNAITSIYWVPTMKSPKLILGKNLSDHVHYYQGGGYAFLYYIYSPITQLLRQEILGPNLLKGQQLQVSVASGEWKCGHLVELETTIDRDDDATFRPVPLPVASPQNTTSTKPDYVIIGEGVGPGFDIHDFCWITECDLNNHAMYMTSEQTSLLQQFLHTDTTVLTNKEQDFDEHYDDNDIAERRMKERV